MAKLKFDIAKHFSDPSDMPAYSFQLAAHYLRVPVATLRYWVLGKKYRTDAGDKYAEPIIIRPDPGRALLSFRNLAEAHILRALRKEQEIQLPHIRSALDYIGAQFQSAHPLLEYSFKTDGARLFVEKLGKLIDASGFGQSVMPEVMDHLERLEFENNVVARLYPFTRRDNPGPKSVFIDPRYSFGRLVLDHIYVPTAVIGDRYEAGEPIDELARDYGCQRLDIEEAIRCELSAKAA